LLTGGFWAAALEIWPFRRSPHFDGKMTGKSWSSSGLSGFLQTEDTRLAADRRDHWTAHIRDAADLHCGEFPRRNASLTKRSRDKNAELALVAQGVEQPPS